MRNLAAVADGVRASAAGVLARFAAADRPGRPGLDHPADPGPAILAAAVAADPAADDRERTAAHHALARWLAGLRSGAPHPGLFGAGLAGSHLGLLAAGAVLPALHRPDGMVAATRRALLGHCAGVPWRTADVGWSDYDLATGPAGALVALAADPGVTRGELEPVVGHLVGLCDRDDLGRFQVRRLAGDGPVEWNRDRVNAGTCHGVPGVAAALCAVADAHGLDEPVAAALRRIARWLVVEAYRDADGLLGWTPAGRAGDPPPEAPVRRQAWCYGNPGVAWTLWEAGRVLDDPALREFAGTAFGSFLDRPEANLNEDIHDGLGICHGSAGLLLVADAFGRYAGLAGAGPYRDRVEQALLTALPLLPAWAAADASLLSGATGVLTALLAVRSPAPARLALPRAR